MTLLSAPQLLNSPMLPRVRPRQIDESDVPAVVGLLCRGFPSRSGKFWSQMFNVLREHPTPSGLPKYGYLLETDAGLAVGTIILIFSAGPGAGQSFRCSVSSWFAEPEFRSYASLLVSKALSHRNVTYLDVTPAPHTWPILRAQGYSQYSKGVFVAFPAARFGSGGTRVTRVHSSSIEPLGLGAFESKLLLDHARYGCMSLLCHTRDRLSPFVFRRRAYKGIPCAQLVYCREVEEFVRLAGPLGRFLALHGRTPVVVDANGPIAGLIGRFFNGRMPKFFKGPISPRLGDLAYTETALFGM